MQNVIPSEDVDAGTLIFREGEAGDCAYLIQRGRVEISVDGDDSQVLAILREGELFGEMALIDGEPRSATARAVSECTLLPVTQTLIESKLKTADALTRVLLKLALGRLRRMHAHHRDANSEEGGSVHDQTLQRVVSELTLATDLHKALESDELELHFQPIVRLADGALSGLEVLSRWNRAGAGYVPPQEFITVAEETNLILPLGRQLLRRACAALTRIESQLMSLESETAPLFVAVNVSARQLYADNEVGELLDVIHASDLPPERVKLEITESVLLDDPPKAAAAMRQLADAGVRLAIDDFGTGYSSLNYLHRFPLHTLKIDRSFVDNLMLNDAGQSIVRAIVALAHELGMQVVAEGIEQAQQQKWLSQHNCEFAQGYLISRPLPEDDLIRWATKRSAE